MLHLLSHSIFTNNLLLLQGDKTEGGGKGSCIVAKDDSALVVDQGKDGFLIL